MKTKKTTISAMIIALYIVIMYFTQGFSFGQYQIRLATSLYSLAYIYPFLTIPLAIANALSNTLMGGLGIIDIIGGFFVGYVVAKSISQLGKLRYNIKLIFLPIFFIGLIVPTWLAPILQLPYYMLAINISIGQIIPGILGVIVVDSLLRKQLPLRNNDTEKK